MQREKFAKVRNHVKSVALGHFRHVQRFSTTPITKAELEGFVLFQLGENADPNVVNGCVKFIERDRRWEKLHAA